MIGGVKRTRSLRGRAGVTLIEILLVLTLVAAIVGAATMGLGLIGQADVRGESLRLSSTIRYVYNASVTQNRTLQLVIDLDEGTMTVDELNIAGGLSRDQLEGRSLAIARGEEDAASTFEGRLEAESGLDAEDQEFAPLSRSSHEGAFLDEDDSALRTGVQFIGVMTSHHEELQTEGIATINFFPSGFVERSIIYLGDEAAKDDPDEGGIYTLMVNPLTGQSTIRPGMVDIEESFFEEEEERD